MINSREQRAYERAEIRFRKACLDASSPYSNLVWRFMSKKDIRSLISGLLSDVREEEDIAPSAVPSIVSVVQELLADDLLREVGEPTKDDFRIYWLTLRGGRANDHNPLELVSALNRDGVVSHHSALVFHDLSDIRATSHFLTAPRKRPTRRDLTSDDYATSPDLRSDQNRGGGSIRPKIGTKCFSLAGVEYRLRHSYPEHIFGVLEPWVDDYERIRVFGFERALLDAVNDPACNGGMRGVIEAWQKGAETIREEKLISHLHTFDRSSLWRRVGVLAAHVGRGDVAEMVSNAVPVEEWADDPLPLVWNRTKGSIVKPWNVIVPW